MFFLTGVTEYLGEGGTERVAAYVIPVGLAAGGHGAVAARRPRHRPNGSAERDAARREQAERARERDAALEAAARGSAPTGGPPTAEARSPTTTGRRWSDAGTESAAQRVGTAARRRPGDGR